MAKLKLSPPWIEYYNELQAMFDHDDDVRIVYDEDEYIVNMYVNDSTKADAIAELLPVEKVFGNVKLTINVIPSNTSEPSKIRERLYPSVYEKAFYNNPVFSYVEEVTGIFSNPITYVVFVNEVVQYYNDNLSDIHGLRSTLYQEIAKDIFETRLGVYYCTDLPE